VTLDKDRKRIIRERMTKTGESYTTARAHIIARSPAKQSPATQPAAPAVDYSALAGIKDAAIAAKTGYQWAEWVRLLDADGAVRMPHRDIATLVHEKYGVAEWWSQSVTVGYERIKGLREIGQRRDGQYEAGKTRTFNVPVTTLFDAWASAAKRRRWLDGVAVRVRTATRPKTIRLQWPDGTTVIVGFIAKGTAKSVASLVHTKLPDKTALAKAKLYWADRFDALVSVLKPASR
jgi:hypothetical protein